MTTTHPTWQELLARLEKSLPVLDKAVEQLAKKPPAGFKPQLDLLATPMIQDADEVVELEAEVRRLEESNRLLQEKVDSSEGEVRRLRAVLLELSALVDCSIADVEAMLAAREAVDAESMGAA